MHFIMVRVTPDTSTRDTATIINEVAMLPLIWKAQTDLHNAVASGMPDDINQAGRVYAITLDFAKRRFPVSPDAIQAVQRVNERRLYSR
jgi:hypothetical protein